MDRPSFELWNRRCKCNCQPEASCTRVGYHTAQDAVGGLTRAEILGLLR